MKKIPLTNGGSVLIDSVDYDYLSEFSWRKKKSHGGTQHHAVRDVTIGDKKITIRMHRLITEAESQDIVFHVNGNGLDNRRTNLQARQIRPWTGRAINSAFRGVSQTTNYTFEAEIEFAGNTHLVGVFSSPEDAAREYDDAAKRLYGSSARTNF